VNVHYVRIYGASPSSRRAAPCAPEPYHRTNLPPSASGDTLSEPTRQRRKYDSPLRRQRAAETRERIVAAGAELIHGLPIWNWGAVTVRAVAERAQVNERTVYRYFPSERDLRDAVLDRLREESGVDVEGMRLEDVGDLTARMLEYTSSFPIAPRTPRDETVNVANERQRNALLGAVAPFTTDWSDVDRKIAAAVLDVLWSVVSYERLVADWGLDPKDAIRGIRWAIELVEDALRAGEPPT
jgi:AcrR family transcriptional regulator